MQLKESGKTHSPVSGIGLRLFEWVMLFGFCAVFAPAWFALASVWSRLDYYSHGYLVPVAALWAATAQRDVLRRLPINSTGESLFGAEACSGITSIVTLIPLAVILAYFAERMLSRRLVLVASVIPLAILGNLMRVVAMVVGAQHFGVARVTDAPIHGGAGILTFVPGRLALLAISGLMLRFWPVEKSAVIP